MPQKRPTRTVLLRAHVMRTPVPFTDTTSGAFVLSTLEATLAATVLDAEVVAMVAAVSMKDAVEEEVVDMGVVVTVEVALAVVEEITAAETTVINSKNSVIAADAMTCTLIESNSLVVAMVGRNQNTAIVDLEEVAGNPAAVVVPPDLTLVNNRSGETRKKLCHRRHHHRLWNLISSMISMNN